MSHKFIQIIKERERESREYQIPNTDPDSKGEEEVNEQIQNESSEQTRMENVGGRVDIRSHQGISRP